MGSVRLVTAQLNSYHFALRSVGVEGEGRNGWLDSEKQNPSTREGSYVSIAGKLVLFAADIKVHSLACGTWNKRLLCTAGSLCLLVMHHGMVACSV